MDSNDKRNILERFCDFMERDTLGVEVITYGIAGVGLLTAIYKIKPLSKFQKPSDVPYRFIKHRIPLQGCATRVEMNNKPIIYVDHKPLITLPRFFKKNSLPIKVEGVDINMNGLSWLQTIVVGKTLNFVPIRREKNALGCIVILPQKNKEPLHIGEELVKLGFGTVCEIEPRLLEDKENLNYKQMLESAQKQAKRRRNGVWHFKIPPSLMWKVQNLMINQANSVLPTFVARRFSM